MVFWYPDSFTDPIFNHQLAKLLDSNTIRLTMFSNTRTANIIWWTIASLMKWWSETFFYWNEQIQFCFWICVPVFSFHWQLSDSWIVYMHTQEGRKLWQHLNVQNGISSRCYSKQEKYSCIHVYVPFHILRASHWDGAKHMATWMSLLFSSGTELSYSRHTTAFYA